MKLGIYMGSFNPPHKGHIDVVNYLINNHYLDKILIVPTLNYWNKQDLINLKDRINMLKFFENDKIMIDTINNQYIYTVELIEELKKQYPNDELYLIIGADNLISFDKWKNYQELLKNKIIVMNRDNIDINKYLDRLGKNNFIVISDYPFINVSSSEIRNNLDNEYLDSKVLKYIRKNNLYQK